MKQSGKNWWLLGAIALVLIVGIALGIFFFLTPDSATSLKPGGLIRGVDGVSVAAPPGALEHRIAIFIEQVEDPRLEVPFPEFLEGLDVVGNFYQITASEEYWSVDTDLIIGLPIPEGVSPDKLAMVTLSPPWSIIGADAYEDPSLRWNFFRGAYDPKLNLFGILLPYIGQSPQVFVLVKWENHSPTENDEDSAIKNYHHYPELASSASGYSGTLLTVGGSQPWFSTIAQVEECEAALIKQAGDTMLAFGSPPPLPRIEVDFDVFCGPGFGPIDVLDANGDPTGEIINECTWEHREQTREALMEAYEAYTSLGFRKPRLRRSISEIAFEDGYVVIHAYEYELRKWEIGELWGAYHSSTSSAYTAYRGSPETPNDLTTRHELFHAVQYAYPEVGVSRRSFGVIEGTASTAEVSLDDTLRRSRFLFVLGIDSPLFAESAGRTGSGSATPVCYQHQDFWVYVGKRINPDDSKLDFLIPLFEKGVKKEHVREFISENSTFESLEDAYWQWAKNHSFEKQVDLCPSYPQFSVGNWSRHGTRHSARYYSAESNWEQFTYEYQFALGDAIITVPEGWRNVGEYLHFTLWDKFVSRAFEITLEPEEDHHYEAILSVERWQPHGSQTSPGWIPISSDLADFKYKFYETPCLDINYCLNVNRENNPHIVRLYDDPIKFNLLVSNMSEFGRFRVKVDTNILQSPKDLTIKSTGISEALVSAHVMEEYGGDYILYDQLTNYTIEDIRAGTIVILVASDDGSGGAYIPGEDLRVVFSHWSGAVESTAKTVNFVIDEDSTVIAHYRVIEVDPDPELIAPLPGREVEGPSFEIPDVVADYFSLSVGAISVGIPQVSIEANISSASGHGGTTGYILDRLESGIRVNLVAPEYIGSGMERYRFTGWSGAVSTSNRSITLDMDADKSITALYLPAPAVNTLIVNATGDDRVGVSIASNTGHGGRTNYQVFNIEPQAKVHLEAPEHLVSGTERKRFNGWSGAVSSSSRAITFVMDGNKTVTANYVADPADIPRPRPTYTLAVSSSADDPSNKIGVDISSKTGHGGRTPYTITGIQSGTEVQLEAPSEMELAGSFSGWSIKYGNDYVPYDKNSSIKFMMDENKEFRAVYWLQLF